MEDIVEVLRDCAGDYGQFHKHVGYRAADEIESLRAQLAEVTKERNEWKDSAINGGNATYLREQLLATQAHAARLAEALSEYARKEECEGFYESTAHKALSTPINLDALHE